MLTGPDFPSTARCLKCGYFLCGLPSPVCPECGRTFDPADASTYDLRPPNWRRRRKKRIALAVAGCILLWAAFGPRGVLTGKLTFTCTVCGDQTTVYRFEAKPPRWIPFRYPGIFWTFEEQVSTGRGLSSCPSHAGLTVSVRFDMHNGGWASSTGSWLQGGVLTLNGMETTVATGPGVLKHLMHPLNNGVGP